MPEIVSTNGFCHVSAREVLECEVEGADYLLTTAGATGVVDGTITVGAILSPYNGRLRVQQTGDESMYRVRGLLAPLLTTANGSTVNNAVRLLLEAVSA